MHLLSGTSRDPPRRLRIWAFGRVESSKGAFLFDRKAAASVMRAYRRHGNLLCFDYEHKAISDDGRPGDGKSAGWFKLELCEDGLYATDVRWTDKASAEISAREWLYFSPAFASDKTGRITELVNVALTNIPATHRLRPLVAASRKGTMDPKEDEDKLADAATETEDEDEGKAAKLARCKALRAELAALEAECGETEKLADDEEDDAAEGDDDPEAEPAAKLSLLSVARKVTKLSKASEEELSGALVALSEQAAEAVSLRKQLAKLTGATKRSVVDKAIASGQLQPSQRQWALSQSDVALKGYLAVTPKRAVGATEHHEPSIDSQSSGNVFTVGGRTVTLSREELLLSKQLGTDPAAYAAHKLARA